MYAAHDPAHPAPWTSLLVQHTTIGRGPRQRREALPSYLQQPCGGRRPCRPIELHALLPRHLHMYMRTWHRRARKHDDSTRGDATPALSATRQLIPLIIPHSGTPPRRRSKKSTMAVVAVSGGTGDLGRTIVSAIADAGRHNVIVLSRTVSSSREKKNQKKWEK